MSSDRVSDRDVDAEAPTASVGGDPIAVAPTVDSVELAAPAQIAADTRIGRFVVTGTLGQGGMGVVLAAHDPGLDRAVAIKLLRGEHRRRDSIARLGREAQAMAKLSHPNVVTVYEIGEHAGSTYIAMELIDGHTLRAWRSAKVRGWREIVERYVGAGRGLAAAHAAGLVHRDFKPDNVLIGADGRSRVTDFGLVASEARAIDSSEAAGVSVDSALTVQGALLGTPAYMAPEQWRGEPVDARTDQFAFCVALWEALYGERPFGGDTTPLLREAILDGTPRPPRRGADVPRWLAPVLRRGLARDPAARWPSLDTLLAQLAGPGRGRAIAGVAIGAVTAAAIVVFVLWRRGGAPSCTTLERKLAGVWDDPRRAAVTEALGGAERAAEVIGELDRYATIWSERRVQSCDATRRGTQTSAARALRDRCLDDALGALDRVAAELGAEVSVPQALSAIGRLPDQARCDDAAALAALAPRPTEPARAAKLRDVEAILASAEIAHNLEHHAAAIQLAERALADAAAVQHAPTLAALHLVIGTARTALEDNQGAEVALREALRAADAGRDDHRRLDAYVVLIGVLISLGRQDEARAVLADAHAALDRIASPAAYEARLIGREAELVQSTGDDAGGVAIMQRAMPLFEEAFGERSLEMAQARYRLGGWMLAAGDIDGAEPLLEQARASLIRFVGEDGAVIAKVDNARSVARLRRGDLDGAIALQESAIAIRTRIDGADSPSLGNSLYTLGAFYKMKGRTDDAAAALNRSLDMLERAHGPDHPRVAMALNELAETFLSVEREAEGTPPAVRAVEMADRLELSADIEAKSRYMLAVALWEKDRPRALALALRARDEYRAFGDEANALTIDAWLEAPD